MKIVSGIYKIQSTAKPNRVYVGSSVNVRKRIKQHISELENNKHANKRIQNHYNKYGGNDLCFSLITGCDKDDLLKLEQFYIDAFAPYFNICPTAGNTLGCKCSEETRRKISEKATGRKVSEETREKLRIARLGWKWSDDVKQKMSTKAMGNQNAVGTVPSEETRRKLRESKIGNTWGFKKGHAKMGGKVKRNAA